MNKNKKMKFDVPSMNEQRDTLMLEYVGATGGFNWANTSDKIVQATFGGDACTTGKLKEEYVFGQQKTQRRTTASNGQK